VRTAVTIRGDCDMSADFDLGIELMVRGLDCHLQQPEG
jgi:hypothetical protein